MRKVNIYLIFSLIFLSINAKAQFENFKDSVVQLYGVVMTADSLKGVPAVSIVLKGQNRGTISNDAGVFSIVVLKGDKIEFSSIGFKPKTIIIPNDLVGNQYSLVQLMVMDTVYLPATIIKQRLSRQQFERDFVNSVVPYDEIAILQKNNSATVRRFLMSTIPADGKEASVRYFQQASQKLYYSGQLAPQNIFNPVAWFEFIKAWKRGDFKRKN